VSGDCTRNTSGSGIASVTGNCAIPGGLGGQVDTAARFKAPIAFDPSNPSAYRLAEVGTSTTATINVYSSAGPELGSTLRFPVPGVSLSASATYVDYLELGAVRPTSLTLSFELSGTLQIPPAELWRYHGYTSETSYSVAASAGTYYPFDTSFGAFSPYADGAVFSTTTSALGGPPTTTETKLSNPVGEFSHTTAPGAPGITQVTVTLGSPFFSNPANGWLLLNIDQSTLVSSPAAAIADIAFGTVQSTTTSADFISTFRMVGLTAYDEFGTDITASAIVGFQSMAPVPEPEVYAMLLAGLGLLGWHARRTRRAPYSTQRGFAATPEDGSRRN